MNRLIAYDTRPNLHRTVVACAAMLCALVLLLQAVPAHASNEGNEGGLSFNDATPIAGSAAVQQELVIGEYLYWRVDLKPGQKLDVDMTLESGRDYPSDITDRAQVTVYSPLRSEQQCAGDQDNSELINGSDLPEVVKLSCETEPVGTDDTSMDEDYSQPGTYYVSAAMAEASDDAKGLEKPLTMEFTISGDPQTPAEWSFDPGMPPKGAKVPEAWKSSGSNAGQRSDDEGSGGQGSSSDDSDNDAPNSGSTGDAEAQDVDSAQLASSIGFPTGVFLAAGLLGAIGGFASTLLGRRRRRHGPGGRGGPSAGHGPGGPGHGGGGHGGGGPDSDPGLDANRGPTPQGGVPGPAPAQPPVHPPVSPTRPPGPAGPGSPAGQPRPPR